MATGGRQAGIEAPRSSSLQNPDCSSTDLIKQGDVQRPLWWGQGFAILTDLRHHLDGVGGSLLVIKTLGTIKSLPAFGAGHTLPPRGLEGVSKGGHCTDMNKVEGRGRSRCGPHSYSTELRSPEIAADHNILELSFSRKSFPVVYTWSGTLGNHLKWSTTVKSYQRQKKPPELKKALLWYQQSLIISEKKKGPAYTKFETKWYT